VGEDKQAHTDTEKKGVKMRAKQKLKANQKQNKTNPPKIELFLYRSATE